MPRWIALLRGINVGGKHLLPMKALASELAELQLTNIRTYIQSGNVVLDADEKNGKALAKKITALIEARHGFAPHVLLLSRTAWQQAIDANPFPQATSDPQSLHFFFLDQPPNKPNLQALEQAKSATESYVLAGSVFYLHAPEGVGRSKLAATVEKQLGVPATARNYRTVEKIAELVKQE